MSYGPGDTIGDYQILGILGRGGMGAVYRVRNLLSDREEAMKIVLPGADASPEVADRFIREIKIQASLQHPHIASLRTAVRAGDRILMIMELIEGLTLDMMLREGPIALDAAFRIGDDILGALSYAHGRGVVHRDIKPSNILVTSRGMPKLTDFGIARASGDNQITKSGMAIGSVPYMSPEQVMSKPTDERSDIYSFGITLYEALTGRRPFQKDSEYAMMDAHLSETPTPLNEVFPAVPHEMSSVVLRALAKSPEQRFQTAAAFQTALRDAFFGMDRSKTVALTSAAPSPSDVGAKPPSIPAIEPKDLMRIESKLAEALGPIAKNLVAKAAPLHPTAESLARYLAEEIPGDRERTAFLRAFAATSGSGESLSPSGSRQKTPVSTGSRPVDAAMIAAAQAALTPYLGPISAILVKKTAARVRSAEELRDMLAEEIADQKDREAFLKALGVS